MKRCTSCGEVKPLDEFGKNSRMKDGIHIYCRPCIRQKSAAARAANPDAARAAVRASQARRRDKKSEYTRTYYEANRDRILARQQQRREQDYERLIQIERESRAKRKEWQRPRKNERQRLRNRQMAERTFLVTEKELRRLYSQPCFHCGSMDSQSVDHIIPLARGGRHSIGNLMTLCRSCNASKNARFLVEWRRAKTPLAA